MDTPLLLPKSPSATASEAPRGSWWVGYPLGSEGDAERGKPWISIKCPSCGQSATLRHPDGGHTIEADGTVKPSVVCPYKPCEWHVWIRLQDWKEPG